MIAEVDIAPFLTDSVLSEIRAALPRVRHGRARLIRLPVLEFAKAIDRVVASGRRFAPFAPRLCGLPVDSTVHAHPEIVVVHDDDTNGAVNARTELEA